MDLSSLDREDDGVLIDWGNGRPIRSNRQEYDLLTLADHPDLAREQIIGALHQMHALDPADDLGAEQVIARIEGLLDAEHRRRRADVHQHCAVDQSGRCARTGTRNRAAR
ncbi:hypothetical protein HNR08_003467 [Cellulomonas hominis]|uniref:Uncharacterized protein n=1 Tax=Cellulomonas hominis TaxID=156981 RepID=A0A7W8SGL8_9CELL|nr:hypothetical protein [Cellulomonas hominis]MBB5474731.1 hypothetical protein [Cellulomonas hominis]